MQADRPRLESGKARSRKLETGMCETDAASISNCGPGIPEGPGPAKLSSSPDWGQRSGILPVVSVCHRPPLHPPCPLLCGSPGLKAAEPGLACPGDANLELHPILVLVLVLLQVLQVLQGHGRHGVEEVSLTNGSVVLGSQLHAYAQLGMEALAELLQWLGSRFQLLLLAWFLPRRCQMDIASKPIGCRLQPLQAARNRSAQRVAGPNMPCPRQCRLTQNPTPESGVNNTTSIEAQPVCSVRSLRRGTSTSSSENLLRKPSMF